MTSVSPYRDGVRSYIDAGWDGIVPVRGKSLPVKGFTGRSGEQMTPDQSLSHAADEKYAGYNLALRVPPGICGIDVDDYGVKEGRAQLDAWEQQYGHLPPAPYSTSRGAGSVSRIIWFRYESGTDLASTLSADVEVIQHYHRYAVVWPSVHPDTGQTYRWYSAAGEELSGPPERDSLPLLPDAWVQSLAARKVATRTVPGDGLSVGEVMEECTFSNNPDALSELISRVYVMRATKSHHDTMLNAVFEAVRCSVVGDFPAQDAWDALHGIWCSWEPELTAEKKDRPVAHEFDAFWAYACPRVNTDYERARRDEKEKIESGAFELVWEEDKPKLVSLLHVPDSFWAARPVFAHIRQAAHSRSDSADPALFGLLARLSSLLPVGTRVDTGLLSPLSLNTFVALLDDTGGGKSSGAKMPGALLPVPPWLDGDAYRENIPLGSGEGAAELFYGTVSEEQEEPGKDGKPRFEKVRKIVRHNALFYVDEGQTIAKLQDRNGSTLGETIRRAGNGETLGQTNANHERTRFVPEGSYCMGMVAGFQPEAAAAMFSEGGLGTPQRFLWVSTSDMALADETYEPAWPGALPVDPFAPFLAAQGADPFVEFRGPATDVTLTVDPRITRELKSHIRQKKSKQITVPVIESHKPRTKAKVAALLAILDERLNVTVEDWDLAEVLWSVSVNTQQMAMDLNKRRSAEARESEDQRVIDLAAQTEVAKRAALDAHEDSMVSKVARRLVRIVSDPSKRSDTRAYAIKNLAGRDKKFADEAFDLAVELGWLTETGEGAPQPGPVTPK